MHTNPDSIEGTAAEERKDRMGNMGMIPSDLWWRVLSAERAMLMRPVSKIARAELERAGENAAIVIVKKHSIQKTQKLVENLKNMQKWGRIRTLVLNSGDEHRTIGVEGAARLAGVLGQCTFLFRPDLSFNDFGAEGAGRIAGGRGNAQFSWTFHSNVHRLLT